MAIQRRIAGRYWRQVSVAHASGLLAGTERINNWDLVDAVAPYVVGPWLIDQERSVLDRLATSSSL